MFYLQFIVYIGAIILFVDFDHRLVTAKQFHMYHSMILLVCSACSLSSSPRMFLLLKQSKIIIVDFFAWIAGANAVEFIINHAEVSITFAQESKIPAVYSLFLIFYAFLFANCKLHCTLILRQRIEVMVLKVLCGFSLNCSSDELSNIFNTSDRYIIWI